jgi:hypothetical protein
MEKTIGFGTMTKETRDGLTKIEITGYTGYTLHKETYGDITADDVITAYQGDINREYNEQRYISDIYSPKDADYYPTFCGAYLDDGTFIIADNFVELRAKAKAEGGYLRQAYVVRTGFWKAHRNDTYQQFMSALNLQGTNAMRPMTAADLLPYLPKEEVED